MEPKPRLAALGLFLALAASGALGSDADVSEPEACDAGSSDDDARGDALLQRMSQTDLGLAEGLSEDSESAAEAEARTTASAAADAGAWLGALLSDGAVSPATAKVAEDGRSALVTFNRDGRALAYKLHAFSVYAEGAELLAHTASGVERRPVPGPTRTFQARDGDNAHGRWASAVLEPDGSVTGLFQTDEGVMRLEPLGRGTDAEGSAALLEAAVQTHGIENPHLVRRLDVSGVLSGNPAWGLAAALLQRPCVKVGGECVHDGGDDLSDGIDHIPHMSPNQSEAPLLSGRAAWTGTKWWPGCYSSDRDLHDFKIGVVVDHDAFEEHGSQAVSKLEAMFVETTFVYEHQFHTKVLIGYQKVYESSAGAPSYAVGCSPVLKLEDFKAKAASDIPAGMGASHLFTGCGTGYGTVGVARGGDGGGERAGRS
uniref:Uncharacterized protein n=1 Tax=Alexandrium monilatum TaxID=311494 RepID=A0A7S4TB10_9DINO